MMAVDRTMLAGAFCLIPAGTAAAIHGGVAVDLLKEGVSAIRDAAFDDAQGAAFADGGAGLPIRMDFQGTDAPEAGGGEFADSFQEKAGDSGYGC
jgi:hypothetical protein